MEADFIKGCLAPLLGVVKRDRDLILEVRDRLAATIYCKGQAIEVKSCRGGYELSADEKFLAEPWRIQTEGDANSFIKENLPFVKQRIAEHRSAGMEIEFEQALIRANNLEPKLNTDYFAVDRQALLGVGNERIDVLGVYWKNHSSTRPLDLALIEVKYGLKGGIESITEQIAGYCQALTANIDKVVVDAEKLLKQKLRMGLITSLNEDARKNLEGLSIARDPKRVRILVALVDYNPASRLLKDEVPKLEELKLKLALVHPIEVFHLGFGLWQDNAVQNSRAASA